MLSSEFTGARHSGAESDEQLLAYRGWDHAAQSSGLGRNSLIDAADQGKLIVRKSGRRTVILRDDLLAYLRSLPLRKADQAAA